VFKKSIRVFIDELPEHSGLKFKCNSLAKSANEGMISVKENSEINISASQGFITVSSGRKNLVSHVIEIFPTVKNNFIDYKGKKYRGIFKLVISGSKITLINELEVEDYLKGVLPLEMGNISGAENAEALKAFSIVARNFSYMKLERKNPVFDVYTDTRDQVYGGYSVEKASSNKAINETAGMILTYNHSPAEVFYFSSCGGYTEDVGNVFSQKSIPYLTTVKDNMEPNCKIAPNFEWKEIYTGGKIVKRLFESKLIENTDCVFVSMEAESRFKSGRVNALSIKLRSFEGAEKEVKIYSNNIRRIIKQSSGNSILRSTMFQVETKGSGNDAEIVLTGKGNGHGVGLCQWGAIAKSRRGDSFREILAFYFPGTRVEKIDD